MRCEESQSGLPITDPMDPERLEKFTNTPFKHATFRPFPETNYLKVYDACQYKTASKAKRESELKECLRVAANIDTDALRSRDGKTIEDPEEKSVLVWTQDGVYNELNNAILCDDPDMLADYGPYLRSLNKFIGENPPEVSVSIFRGTKITKGQKKCGR